MEETNIFDRLLKEEDYWAKTLLINGFQLDKNLKAHFRNSNVEFEKGCVFIPEREARSIIKSAEENILKEIFDKFDEYACIKNDKWYLDYKKEKLDRGE